MTYLHKVLAATPAQTEIIDVINDSACEGLSFDEEAEEPDEDGFYELEDCLNNNRDTQYYFNDPKPLPKGTWLIHFTKNPESIQAEGFHGANLDHLGLTRGGGVRREGEHALAYNLETLKEWKLSRMDYGPHAVVFQSDDAVEASHIVDHPSKQVIFPVDSVRNLHVLKYQNGKMVLKSKEGDIPLADKDIWNKVKSMKSKKKGAK